MELRGLAAVAAMTALGVAGCANLGWRDRSEMVVDPTVCIHTTVPIYFEEGQANLTEPARELIRTGSEAIQGCRIDRVRIVGLASATGNAQNNMTLSERRAVTVAQALADAGLPAPAFDVEAAGEAGAREGGVSEPVRRRVEVIIEAAPR